MTNMKFNPDYKPTIYKNQCVHGYLVRSCEFCRLEREKAELLILVDGAKPIVECWHAKQPYNIQWKKDWMSKANCILKETLVKNKKENR